VSLPGTWQQALQKNLEAYSFIKVIDTVGGALSASRLVTRHEPDMVLIDSSIPGDDAAALIQTLKSENRETLSIVISDTAQQRRKMSRSGADYTVSSGSYEPQLREIFDLLREHPEKKVTGSGTLIKTSQRGERKEVDVS